MSVQVKSIISQRELDITTLSDICSSTYTDGVSSIATTLTSDGTSRTAQEWMEYIAAGGSGSAYLWLSEYIGITHGRFLEDNETPVRIKIVDEDLAEMLGFPYNTQVNASGGVITAQNWGNSKLIVSGQDNSHNSFISIAEENRKGNIDFPSKTTYFVGKAPISNYTGVQNIKKYVIKSSWLHEDYEVDVVDFMEANGEGQAEQVKAYGFNRPSSSDDFYLDMQPYGGCIQPDKAMEDRNLLEFNIGLLPV